MLTRILIRNILKGIGVLGMFYFLIGIPGSYYVLTGSVAALLLGVTDFGRQCPLALSIHDLVYRMKTKRQSQIL